MNRLLKSTLAIALVICVICLTARACSLMYAWAVLPSQLAKEARQTRVEIGEQLGTTRLEVLAEVYRWRINVTRQLNDAIILSNYQITDSRQQLLAEVAASRSLIDAKSTDALVEIKDLHADVKPLLANYASLAAKLTEVPDRLELALQPSWKAIEPEITCRHADGTGYGGCWHSRISGLFGEAERVGGVFTKEFPRFTSNINGMTDDGHAWTAKYVHPHPLNRKQKLEVAGKVVLGLGTSALRGGVF